MTITPAYFTLAIIMMAVITFMVRYAFFTTTFSINLHPQIRRLLVFTAPCILTAMAVPIVFQHGLSDGAGSLLTSSYFLAGILAVILSILIRQTLLVIILSLIGFYALRYMGFQ